jgi:poly(3-hydroxybutyrate) depolymerase
MADARIMPCCASTERSDMKTTSANRFNASPSHHVRLACGVTAVCLFVACGGDDPPATSAPVTGTAATGGSKATTPPAGGATAPTKPSGTAATGGGAPINTGIAGTKAPPPSAGKSGVVGPDEAPGTAGKSAAGAGGSGGSTATAAAGAGGAPTSTGTAGAGSTNTGTPTKSEGCGKPAPTLETSIMVGSATGKLIVDVPKDYDSNKAYPLIMVWHGAGVKATDFHGYLNMQAVAGAEAIIVTPECLNDGSSWPTDMAYPNAIIDHFEASYCVDSNRLFTTGHSMGGMYTGQVGCQLGDKLRADAVLAAPHPTGTCVGKDHMAAMMSVGGQDFVATAATEFAWWSKEKGCSTMTTPVDPMSFYKGALDESGTCVEYSGCGANTPVRTCTFEGGHEIPPWVASAVWDFFKKL